MNDGGGNGASCVGIKVRTDTTKLSDMVIARFGDGLCCPYLNALFSNPHFSKPCVFQKDAKIVRN